MAQANPFNPFAEVEEEFADETNAVRNRNGRRLFPMNFWTNEWDLARKNNFITDVNALFRTLGLRNRLELQENHLNGDFRLRRLAVNINEDHQDQNNDGHQYQNNDGHQDQNNEGHQDQNNEDHQHQDQNNEDHQDQNNDGLELNLNDNEDHQHQDQNNEDHQDQNNEDHQDQNNDGLELNLNDNEGHEPNLSDNDIPHANPNVLQDQKIELENRFYTIKGRVTKARKRVLYLGREIHDNIMAAHLILKFFRVLPDENHRFSFRQEIDESRNRVAQSVGRGDLNFSEEVARDIILHVGQNLPLEIVAENEFLFLRTVAAPPGFNVLVDLRVEMDLLHTQIEGILEAAQHQNVHLV